MALIREWKMRCLICMKNVPAEIPVFGSQGQRKNLRRMMTEYLNFTPRENENEPKNMCESCYDTLQKVNDLKGYAKETKQNIRLLRNFHQQGSEEGRVEAIRLWLSSQRMQQVDMSVSHDHHSSAQQQPPPPPPPPPPPQQQQQPPPPPPQQQPPPPPPPQQQPPPPPPPPPQQQQQQPPLPLQRDFTHSSSSSSSSSISTNEATGSIALNISAVVSENSDARSRTQSVSSTAARQERSQRVLHHRGRKRPGTPLPFSTPSRRSRSPQPGSLPPESSRKQHRSAARSLKTRKIAVQQNGDHSGSPWPGSRPPETARKSSVSRKRSATKREERVEFHRAQSVSPVRGNSCNASTRGENKRQRGRPRSKSLPPSKCRKMFDQAERDCKSRNETASKPTPWKPYLDDDICFGRITTSCDLKEFKKHIPFVKLQRVKVPTTPSTEKKSLQFRFPESQRSTMGEFTELRARQPPQREHQQHGPGKHLMMGTSEFPKQVKLVEDVVEDGIVQQFCWICHKTFLSIKNLEQHLDEHKRKNRPGPSSSQDVTEPTRAPSFFACNLCEIQFSSNGFLQRHMINHSEKKWSHKCGVCEETFQTSAILKRHMGNHNISGQVSTTTTQDATCHEEEKEKEVEEEKEKEEEEQPREQVYACSCCLQEFTSEQALGKHMLQHRKCTLCNKTFIGKDELAAHVGECHKVCKICDETVTDEEELQFHLENSHEKCNLCGEQFLFEEELGAHLKKHPYRCVMCLSAFNDKVQRIEHIKLTHPEMLELLVQTFAKEKTAV